MAGALLKFVRSGVLTSARAAKQGARNIRFEDQSAVLEWFPTEMRTVRHYQPIEIKRQRMNFESVAAAISYATTKLPEGFRDNATITAADGNTLRWADIEAMS